jgi:hypothetical protein
LRPGLSSGLFPSDFLIKILYVFLIFLMRATCPDHVILLDFTIVIISRSVNIMEFLILHTNILFHMQINIFCGVRFSQRFGCLGDYTVMCRVLRAPCDLSYRHNSLRVLDENYWILCCKQVTRVRNCANSTDVISYLIHLPSLARDNSNWEMNPRGGSKRCFSFIHQVHLLFW